MKIGFFGTPDLASRCLDELACRYDISFVVTSCDKPRGRNQHVSFCPAKDTAVCNDLNIMQPEDLNDPGFVREIRESNAEVFVVVAYGRIIPREIFDHPPLKTINLHPSLLPKYRGAAPMQWAIINGETETGITVQLINEKLDAGDIILQEKIHIADDMTAGCLEKLVYEKGPDVLDRAIQLLKDENFVPQKQDESAATYCGKINKDMYIIDWHKPALEIHNLVRGLNPKPVAHSTFRDSPVKIWKTALFHEELADPPGPGEIRKFGKKRIIAGTSRGVIEILNIQPANKKNMDALSFINGYRINENECFG